MSRISAIEPNETQGKTRETLGAVQKMLGVTPHMFRVAAHAPAALDALAGTFGALARGQLRAPVREALALTVAEANGCDYCLSAHTLLGQGAGLSESDIRSARDAAASDPKTAALLRFARKLVVDRGRASDADLDALRRAGATDGEIVEVVAHVGLNVFTNYLNLVADTDIDFPVVRAAERRG
jgi:uncharacterized peroxidase-related enzyme